MFLKVVSVICVNVRSLLLACCISKLSLPQRQLQVLLKLSHFCAATPLQLTTGQDPWWRFSCAGQDGRFGIRSPSSSSLPYLDEFSQRIIQAIILTC